MITTLTSLFLSFALVSVAGAVIAHRLQHRNWIRQQQFASQEKSISELKLLFAELDNLLGRRLYRTRRLLYALRRFETNKFRATLEQYDDVIGEWNEKRNSFQIRLVRVVSQPLAHDFEHDLSRRFVGIGQKLERLTRRGEIRSGSKEHKDILTELEMELDSLSRSVYEFLRSIYIRLQKEQSDLHIIDRYDRVPDNEDQLASVSTWFLFKSLFIPARKVVEES